MPASVPTDTEFNTLSKSVQALSDRITKLEQPSTTYDSFNYTETFVEGQNSKNGKWHCDFLGGGFARTDGTGLVISPAGPDLRSVQVKSTQQWGDAKFTFT